MSSPRRFLLARTPLEGAPELLAEDREHALRVLRVSAGDRVLGLDGRGRAWELEVTLAERRRLVLQARGPAREEPPAGAPGAPLDWIEVACPLPKAGRAEDMFDRLTQLGVARLVPLVCERAEPQARELSQGRRKRLERAAREAIKQCGRLWLPELAEPVDFDELLQAPGTRVVLAAKAPRSLAAVLSDSGSGAHWVREAPLTLIAGPEGGFTDEERAALQASGAQTARLAPYVLRIETAVEAALAVAVG